MHYIIISPATPHPIIIRLDESNAQMSAVGKKYQSLKEDYGKTS
nr:MAG TPA: hypothetical protein [Caudoviricetes sp.]